MIRVYHRIGEVEALAERSWLSMGSCQNSLYHHAEVCPSLAGLCSVL